MAKAATIREPNLPWLDSREDRFFRALTIVMVILFLVMGIVMSLQTLPELVQKNLVDVSPRLAQLILEKQKVEPPPKPEASLVKSPLDPDVLAATKENATVPSAKLYSGAWGSSSTAPGVSPTCVRPRRRGTGRWVSVGSSAASLSRTPAPRRYSRSTTTGLWVVGPWVATR